MAPVSLADARARHRIQLSRSPPKHSTVPSQIAGMPASSLDRRATSWTGRPA